MEETEMDNKPIFICCMLLFLGTMSMVTLSDHPIVLWIAIEATTLVSAPLIFIHRSKEALEATWKYVLICSVGIALALVGAVLITVKTNAKAAIGVGVAAEQVDDHVHMLALAAGPRSPSVSCSHRHPCRRSLRAWTPADGGALDGAVSSVAEGPCSRVREGAGRGLGHKAPQTDQ